MDLKSGLEPYILNAIPVIYSIKNRHNLNILLKDTGKFFLKRLSTALHRIPGIEKSEPVQSLLPFLSDRKKGEAGLGANVFWQLQINYQQFPVVPLMSD